MFQYDRHARRDHPEGCERRLMFTLISTEWPVTHPVSANVPKYVLATTGLGARLR